jgi:drug/metabolite transporter (DMT)-like permease
MDNLLVILSEVVLSAYPLLIKLVDTSVFFQVGLRMIVFTVCAALTAIVTGVPVFPSGAGAETVAVGILNLLHVAGSYVGFDRLAGGNAMALFYTYPVFNILGASAVLGEKLPLRSLPWIGVAVAGAIALAQPSAARGWSALGVAAALLAALTETGIYLWFKSHKDGTSDQPYTKMIQMYGSSAIAWLLGTAALLLTGAAGGAFNISGGGLGAVLSFNAIVGFLGYALRFYLIPRISTVVFSALSFFGIISAYLLSWLFAGEVPTALQAAGAAAIIVANAILVTPDTA